MAHEGDAPPQDAELEALTFTFNEDELSILSTQPLAITVQISPRACDDTRQQYVQACLVLKTSDGYPAVPASIELQNVKGLGDSRRQSLQEALQKEASVMAGEMMLGQLCEAAKDRLSDMNAPEGDCAFCLCPLTEPGQQPDSASLQMLPCYHCYHFSCFANWFAAEQLDRRKKRAELQAERGHAVNKEMLAELGLQTLEHGLFAVLCPCCRMQVALSEFSKSKLKLLAHEAKKPRSSGVDRSIILPDREMERLRGMQQRNKEIFLRQLKVGGIVPDHYAVTL